MSERTSSERLREIARQDLRTLHMLGVDFVPLGQPLERGSSPVRDDSAMEAAPSSPSGATRVQPTSTASPSMPAASSQPASGKSVALEALATRHNASCPHCTTAKAHTQCVFGEGNPDALIMFVGEAPGEEEDRTGRPFVGRAGQLLEKIINAMGLQRADVYIANVLKSRPPNNRTPLAGEIEACGPFLAEQIRIIQPRVLVTLGGPATKLMLGTDVGITKLRGQWAKYGDPEGGLTIPVMPTFHPAYVLRNYTPEARSQVWSDMQEVLKRVGLPVPQKTSDTAASLKH